MPRLPSLQRGCLEPGPHLVLSTLSDPTLLPRGTRVGSTEGPGTGAGVTTAPTLISRDAVRRGGLNPLSTETQALRGPLNPEDPSTRVPAVQVGKPGSGELKGCFSSVGRVQMAPGLTILSLSMKNQRSHRFPSHRAGGRKVSLGHQLAAAVSFSTGRVP